MYKYQLGILIVLLNFSFVSSQGSIPVPYFQPFDSYVYYRNSDAVKLEVEPENIDLTGCPNDNEVLLARNYSWGLYDRVDDDRMGKAMQLTVHEDDHPCRAFQPRTRSEITFRMDAADNETYYIRWEFLIPNDDSFDEIPISDFEQGPYHIIFQIGARIRPPNYPLVGLLYFPEDNASNDFRDLRFLIQSPNLDDPISISRIHIKDAIRKGVWNEIIYKVKWSQDPTEGLIEVKINDLPVVLDEMDTRNPNPDVLWSKLGDFSFLPALQTRMATSVLGVGNNFKFGHYRRHKTETANMFIDNVRVSNFEPIPERPTSLTNEYCNQALKISNIHLEAETIIGATNYKFRFERNNEYYWINSNTPRITWLNHDFLEPSKIYNVQVRTMGNNNPKFDYKYGDICTIQIPHKTKLRGEDCDNLSSNQFYGSISALKINNATNYKFRFKHGSEEYLYHNSSTTFIRPADVNGLETGKIYTVDIRSTGSDFDFNYGTACQIYFEPSQINIENSLKDSSQLDIFGDIKIYPNPAREYINLVSNCKESAKYFIYNKIGQLQIEGNNTLDNKINIESLKDGVYFLKFQIEDDCRILTFIKD